MRLVYLIVIFALLALLFWTNRQDLKRDYPMFKPVIAKIEKIQKDLVKTRKETEKRINKKVW